ncbi:MAG TPA: rhomboid family intramembrane serine protease [Gammaproteobacteria bacterium]|nr:rhomboid family intramembrane serine protease [Gammaproteobacteria bacterium]
MRVLFVLLGVAGIGITAFLAFMWNSWLVIVLLGPLLGLPFVFGIAGWPESWFNSKAQADIRDARGRPMYRRYTRLEYILLALMALSGFPIYWLRSLLPAGLNNDSDPGLIAVAVFLSVAVTAYSWQKVEFSRKTAVQAWALLIGTGVLLLVIEASSARATLYGFMFAYSGAWSLLREGLMHISEKHAQAAAPVVLKEPLQAPPAAAKKGTFATLPMTMGILLVLAAVFALELLAGHWHSPDLDTLVAVGALSHPLVLQSKQWYRLFSSALLHANLIHLMLNAYALFLAGAILENFVGRMWYFALFAVGALGGSLMSLAINPANLVSVGASGAIMALFAACYVTSFRRQEGESRKQLQKGLLQIVIFSLLPVLGIGGGRIDIAGHLGGILGGGLVGLFLLATWDINAGKPRFNGLATALSVVGGTGFIYAAVCIIQTFPR